MLVTHMLSQLLDIVPRGGVIREAQQASKAVQAVAHSNVNCFAKDAIPLVCVCNNLQPRGVADGDKLRALRVSQTIVEAFNSAHLRVSSTDIQYHGILGPCHHPSHLNVAHAVIDADNGHTPQLRQHACHYRT
jgi:hypothetical protein